jgi:hydroxymethylpyrimidine pyrophosphatase-like HAD family hydrolase
MIIVFDMDNTLTDDFGGKIRPGIKALLQRLVSEGDTLILWTNSTTIRAKEILKKHDLKKYFKQFLYREDYAQDQKNVPKDIRKVNGDFIVDDDPMQVDYNKSIGKNGFLISSYRGRGNPDEKELKQLYQAIRKSNPKKKWLGIFG